MAPSDMQGKVVVITGASSGIGAAAARELAARGATVVPVGRSAERTAAVARSIGAAPIVADFADLAQVRRLADTLAGRCPRIDVLINNAGGLFTPRTLTVDGFETTLQVNHLAPFLLTTLLREKLVASAATAPVRVITTASAANLIGRIRLDDLNWERRIWSSFRAYGTTKLMNIVFTRELARRWAGAGSNITTASFHPGPVATNFASGSWLPSLVYHSPLRSLLLLTSEQGAAPLNWLAADAVGEQLDGGYYNRFRRGGPTRRQARDPQLAAALWDASAALVENL